VSAADVVHRARALGVMLENRAGKLACTAIRQAARGQGGPWRTMS
jgi:hypothetical protein